MHNFDTIDKLTLVICATTDSKSCCVGNLHSISFNFNIIPKNKKKVVSGCLLYWFTYTIVWNKTGHVIKQLWEKLHYRPHTKLLFLK